MPEASAFPFPFQHTGVFTIGTHNPGAPTLQAVLSVPANSSIVTAMLFTNGISIASMEMLSLG